MKRIAYFVIALFSLIPTGCATSNRNHQADIDALNARVAALQGQLSEKDEQMSSLQNQLNDQRMAREAAESAMQSQLQKPVEATRSSSASSGPAIPSDIK